MRQDDHFAAPPVKRAAAHNCVEKMQLCNESDRKGERQDEKASEAGRKDVTGRSQGFGQLSDQLKDRFQPRQPISNVGTGLARELDGGAAQPTESAEGDAAQSADDDGTQPAESAEADGMDPTCLGFPESLDSV